MTQSPLACCNGFFYVQQERASHEPKLQCMPQTLWTIEESQVTGSNFCGTAMSLWCGCAVRLSAEYIAGGSQETDEDR